MSHLSRALASLIEDLREPHGHLQTLENPGVHDVSESPIELVAQRSANHHPERHNSPAQNPSEPEIRDYLGGLAKAYGFPADFINAVANTESSFNPHKVHRNPPHRTKNGRVMPQSFDYGLMQINSSKIGSWVKDPQGHKFKIEADVKSDWKANARAAVAILAEEYSVAELEQRPVTSEQDRAQQAYSGYNGGHGNRDRYLHERRDGLPYNKNDRHFLESYLSERHR